MDIIEAYRTCIKKYAVFQGRARRSEYWLFMLCNNIISLLLSVAVYFAQSNDSEGLVTGISVVSMVYSVFVLLPGLAVTVRRLHDTGHSGWSYFLVLIPIVGAIILLVRLCQDSVPGSNEYGPNPKESGAALSGTFNTGPSNDAVLSIAEPRKIGFVENKNGETVSIDSRQFETVSIKPVLKVKCIMGPNAGKAVTGEVIYVGRDRSLCQMIFPDDTPGVSKVHCMLHTDGKSIEIRDMGSSFGTYLSDRTRLKPNETYSIPMDLTQENRSGMNTIYIGSEKVAITVELSSSLPM